MVARWRALGGQCGGRAPSILTRRQFAGPGRSVWRVGQPQSVAQRVAEGILIAVGSGVCLAVCTILWGSVTGRHADAIDVHPQGQSGVLIGTSLGSFIVGCGILMLHNVRRAWTGPTHGWLMRLLLAILLVPAVYLLWVGYQMLAGTYLLPLG